MEFSTWQLSDQMVTKRQVVTQQFGPTNNLDYSVADADSHAFRTRDVRQDADDRPPDPRVSLQRGHPGVVCTIGRVGCYIFDRTFRALVQEDDDEGTGRRDVPLANQPERRLPGTPPHQDQP